MKAETNYFFIYTRCQDQQKFAVTDIKSGQQVGNLLYVSRVEEADVKGVLQQVREAAGPDVEVKAVPVRKAVRSSTPAKAPTSDRKRQEPAPDLLDTVRRLQREAEAGSPTPAAGKSRVERTPTTYTLYHSAADGWELLCPQGKRLNPPIVTAPAMACYIKRNKLSSRIMNLIFLVESPSGGGNSALLKIAAEPA